MLFPTTVGLFTHTHNKHFVLLAASSTYLLNVQHEQYNLFILTISSYTAKVNFIRMCILTVFNVLHVNTYIF